MLTAGPSGMNSDDNQEVSAGRSAGVTARGAAILSPAVDAWCAGGLSLVLFGLCMLFFERSGANFILGGFLPSNQALAAITATTFYLGFVVNFPHFILSYQLFYVDYRGRIFRDWKYVVVGVIVPAVLASSMAYVTVYARASVPAFIQLMLLLVGWHYAKQVYGIIIFTAARANQFYSTIEKYLLRGSLLSLVALAWVYGNSANPTTELLGFSYVNVPFSPAAVNVFYAIYGLITLGLVIAHVQKYLRTGFLPRWTGVVAYASLAAWYLPLFAHPVFFVAVPLFHSLQYVWFAATFRRNKVQRAASVLVGEAYRKRMLLSVGGYLLLSVVIGALAFYFIPIALDHRYPMPAQGKLQPLLYVALFTVFLNIHHYFIDAVIWRKDSDATKFLL